jgi:hypothetical protein
MPGHGEKPEHVRELAIGALLEKPTQAEAAEAAGVSLSTLKNWLAEPEFRAALRAAARQLTEVRGGRLQHLGDKAVETLLRNLTCGKPAVENRAAVAILEHSGRAAEFADLAADVEDLKRRLGELEHARAGTTETRPGPAESGPAPTGAADALDTRGAGPAD